MSKADLHWTESASCRSLDPDLFFPVADETVYADQIAPIRRICAACPAVRPCLEWALTAGEPDGIWAGTTPGERRYIRAARTTAAALGHRRTRKSDVACADDHRYANERRTT
ncbi:WhiB family transcriptional regulator [Actinomadura napierensis]|uniref:Transcriptional regulator WhiB n=1 Tax=Actinomadura napierensis TaxID=267854 RepID=A0ABN2XZL4_9ACTN